MEHSQLITIIHLTVYPNRDIARGYLEHAYADETHAFADFRVIGFDPDENSCSDMWEEPDGLLIRSRVKVFGIVDGVIGPLDFDDLLYRTFHRAVPMMIVTRAKISLEDSSADEFLSRLDIIVEYLLERISFVFDPEFIVQLDAGGDSIQMRLASTSNEGIIGIRTRERERADIDRKSVV